MASRGPYIELQFRLFDLLHGRETGAFGPDLLAGSIKTSSARDSGVRRRTLRRIHSASLFRCFDVAIVAIAVSSGSSCVAVVLCGGDSRIRLAVAGATMAHFGNM